MTVKVTLVCDQCKKDIKYSDHVYTITYARFSGFFEDYRIAWNKEERKEDWHYHDQCWGVHLKEAFDNGELDD